MHALRQVRCRLIPNAGRGDRRVRCDVDTVHEEQHGTDVDGSAGIAVVRRYERAYDVGEGPVRRKKSRDNWRRHGNLWRRADLVASREQGFSNFIDSRDRIVVGRAIDGRTVGEGRVSNRRHPVQGVDSILTARRRSTPYIVLNDGQPLRVCCRSIPCELDLPVACCRRKGGHRRRHIEGPALDCARLRSLADRVMGGNGIVPVGAIRKVRVNVACASNESATVQRCRPQCRGRRSPVNVVAIHWRAAFAAGRCPGQRYLLETICRGHCTWDSWG